MTNPSQMRDRVHVKWLLDQVQSKDGSASALKTTYQVH